MISRYIFHAENYQSMALNLGILALRLYFGITMAFAHGLGKIPPKIGFIGYLTNIGIPLPGFAAWMAGLSELVGGLCLAFGLATRLNAIGWIITMSVAVFLAHSGDPFSKQELGLSYMVVGLFLLFAGPGKFSVDGLISKK